MSSATLPNQLRNNVWQEDIAIVGMACIFPGAPDLKTYWQNIVSKVDAITDPPPEAWDADIYYDPESDQDDRVYCKRGGYIGPLAQFDPLKYGIMPTAIDGGEPDQWLALQLAYDALADAGYEDHIPEAERTAVLLGKGTYLNYGNLSMVQRGLVVDQTMEIIKTLHPEFGANDLESIRRELKGSLPPFNPETAQGLIPNVIAGRIANRLNCMGPCYTVDGACASSLLAVEIAIRDLHRKEIDLALVGGSQVSTPVPILGLFCRLNALSRSQTIRPFDKDADGTILGEGIGMVVLKRFSDAQRDGNRIYAVIKAVASSSDGRALSVLAPRVEGEELALRRAYDGAAIAPSTVSLIEAHGTATPAGDVAEIQALHRVFGPRNGHMPWCAIGSVKSMISHTMPAAGIAGLIKAALSLYHKVLPPTLNVAEPNPALELEKTAFYINTETRPWIHGSPQAPRRAGVNAFGFGGINAHVILEEHLSDSPTSALTYSQWWECEVCILEAESRAGLVEKAEALERITVDKPTLDLKDLAFSLNTALAGAPFRLAVIASSLEDLGEKLRRALKRLQDPKCERIKDGKGIYFFERQLHSEGKLAMLFPGEGAQYVNMLSDLCVHFPEVRECFDRIDRVFDGHARGYLPSDYIFPPPPFSEEERKAAEEGLWKMDGAIEAVLTANDALFSLLSHLHIKPHVIIGHSTGEYSAMRAAGILDLTEDSDNGCRALELNESHQRVASGDGIPQALLVAVGAAVEEVTSLLGKIDGDLYVGMDNCPHQTVVVGVEGEMAKAIDELDRQGLIYQILPFDRPYHTPLFKPYAEKLRNFFRRWPISPPKMNMYSCTTVSPYPTDVDEIRELAVEHWTRPVEFRKTIERMHADGVRIFLEVGPNGNLSGFVNDILRGKRHISVPANVQHRSGIRQLNHMVGILAAQGVPMDLAYLYRRRAPRNIFTESNVVEGGEKKERSFVRKLATGWPAMKVSSHTVQQLSSRDSIRQSGSAMQPVDPAETPETPTQRDSTESRTASGNRAEELQTGIQQGAALPQHQSTEVMSAYLETMEHFLDTQQQVMQAFLTTSEREVLLDRASILRWPQDHELAPITSGAAGQQTEVEPKAPEQLRRDAPADLGVERAEDQDAVIGPAQSVAKELDRRLLKIVSDRTGYPTDMLGLDVELEADLGIDSIKRVEILGEISKQYGLSLEQDMERVAGLKTLQQIIDFLQSLQSTAREQSGEHGVSGLSHPVGVTDLVDTGAADPLQFPFIDEVISLVPGRELVALRRISLREDIYLRDHTLGGRASLKDEICNPLAVIPFTMSMEMLAEAGAVLRPERVLVGMRNIRARKWIALEEDSVTLKLVARQSAVSPDQVEVKIYDYAEETEPAIAPVVEGVMVYGEVYPEPPPIAKVSLRSERASKWTPKRLYTEAMFHGPSWQGVSSVDRWGEDGSIATLEVLPTDQFFYSQDAKRLVIDPIVLDAAGQIVGFWTMEHLEQGFVVFPYSLRSLHIYRSNPAAGHKVKCQARIDLVGSQQVRTDFDLIAENGQLWMKLEGWEDKRFHLPANVYSFVLSPIAVTPTEAWNTPIASFPNSHSFSCFCVEEFFHQDGGFWRRVFSNLILSQREKQTYNNLGRSEKRQNQWLMGRLVAKDAVRTVLRQRYGMEMGPADVEILQDEYGRPVPSGSWNEHIRSTPCLSLAHTDGMAVAVAGETAGGEQVGVDVEKIRPLDDGFETTAFTPQEQRLLASFEGPERHRWILRFWTAKEATAKALGQGLAAGLQTFQVRDLDTQSGVVRMELPSELKEKLGMVETVKAVHTFEEKNYIVASISI